jgi:nucleotide-binding universal stress UspA family protein
MFERILLAVEKGDGADDEVRAATALALAFSSAVTVFHVRERTVTSAATLERESIPQSFAFAEDVAAEMVRAGVRAEAVIESHEPHHIAGSILAKAQEIGADLIVIGGHSHRSLRDHFFGDRGEALARDARCPLLLVPSSASN